MGRPRGRVKGETVRFRTPGTLVIGSVKQDPSRQTGRKSRALRPLNTVRRLNAPFPLSLTDMRGRRVPGALAFAQADGRDLSRRAVARSALPRRLLRPARRSALGEMVSGELVAGVPRGAVGAPSTENPPTQISRPRHSPAHLCATSVVTSGARGASEACVAAAKAGTQYAAQPRTALGIHHAAQGQLELSDVHALRRRSHL
jgi:hypothetical protein